MSWPFSSKKDRCDRLLYIDLLFRKTKMYANYLPASILELGDYGDLTKHGDFIRSGNILNDYPILREEVGMGKELVGSNRDYFASRTRKKGTASALTGWVPTASVKLVLKDTCIQFFIVKYLPWLDVPRNLGGTSKRTDTPRLSWSMPTTTRSHLKGVFINSSRINQNWQTKHLWRKSTIVLPTPSLSPTTARADRSMSATKPVIRLLHPHPPGRRPTWALGRNAAGWLPLTQESGPQEPSRTLLLPIRLSLHSDKLHPKNQPLGSVIGYPPKSRMTRRCRIIFLRGVSLTNRGKR